MKHILVIDDSPEILAVVGQALKAQGWQPLTAERGEEGLTLARSQPVDLILCDLQMPGISGYEVLSQVRANPRTATIPFVFLSGMSDKPHIRQGMELGADDYIEKPFTIPELVKAVRVRFEKQAELVQRAERKLQELRTSLSLALPHELVTPLNSILGFSSLLKDSVLPPEEVQECARHINEAACRLQRLVENFCFYAHLEVSATDPQKRADLIRSEQYPVVDLLASAAQKVARNHRREQDLSLNLEEATLVVSPSYLQRLVTELVDNAFKFSQPGTLVSLHSRHVETGYHLTVEDQGKGMTAEQIDHVGAHIQFERKFQEQQGSGLGLAISRRLAEAHRGSLWIESTPGKGTKVQVILGR